jgi:hypothetical protein
MSLHEVIDTRVLGAMRLMDAPTGAVIRRPLVVSSVDAKFIRNRSYHYVVTAAVGLEHHTAAFEQPPPLPDVGDIQVGVQVRDLMQRYLPRLLTLALPRDPLPANADQPGSLFVAVPVSMYPAATFPLHPNWSAIRVSLEIEGGPGLPLHGALLRVIRVSDDTVLARGISDARGEALVIIPGIPITNFASSTDEDDVDASGPVVITDTAAVVEVIADGTLPWPVNPDLLEDNRVNWLRQGDEPVTLTLRTGQIETLNLTVDLT